MLKLSHPRRKVIFQASKISGARISGRGIMTWRVFFSPEARVTFVQTVADLATRSGAQSWEKKTLQTVGFFEGAVWEGFFLCCKVCIYTVGIHTHTYVHVYVFGWFWEYLVQLFGGGCLFGTSKFLLFSNPWNLRPQNIDALQNAGVMALLRSNRPTLSCFGESPCQNFQHGEVVFRWNLILPSQNPNSCAIFWQHPNILFQTLPTNVPFENLSGFFFWNQKFPRSVGDLGAVGETWSQVCQVDETAGRCS